MFQGLLDKIKATKHNPGSFKYIIYTQVGEGPTYLNDPKYHLLNEQGLPVNQA